MKMNIFFIFYSLFIPKDVWPFFSSILNSQASE